jgi:hypothetical protein
MNNILIEIYLFFMKLIAHIQIMYNIHIKDGFLGSFYKEEHIKLEYIYVKDGDEIIRTRDTNYVINDPYDFVIKKEYSEKENKYFGQLSDNIDDVLTNKKHLESKFMSITLVYRDNEYDINLDTPINFNVVDNVILDSAFIRWYMNENHDIYIEDKEIYEIKVMDNNVKFHSLTNISYIELKSEKYEITNTNTDSENSE